MDGVGEEGFSIDRDFVFDVTDIGGFTKSFTSFKLPTQISEQVAIDRTLSSEEFQSRSHFQL